MRIGTLLSTPKGIFDHYGVVVQSGVAHHGRWLVEPVVASNSKQYGRPVTQWLSDFRAGNVIKTHGVSPLHPHEVLRRVRRLSQSTYNAVTNNCEHYATAVTGPRRHSPTVKAAVVGGVLTGLAALAISFFNSDDDE